MRAILVFVLCFFCYVAVRATDRIAASASRADVLTAYNAAAASGDRVIVPAGTAEWSSAITVAKQVQIYGAGIGSTIISNTTSASSGLETPIFSVSQSNVIIGGFTFKDSGMNFDCAAITLEGGFKYGRIIVSNRFEGFNFALKVYSPALIFSNQFYNVDTIMRNQGYQSLSTLSAIGTPPFGFNHTNSPVFEDNLIEHTNWSRNCYYIDTEYPAMYFVRYNTFHQEVDPVGPTDFGVDGFDMHGNGNGDGSSILIGPTIYRNELIKHRGGVDIKWLDLRGGGWSLNFSNNITGEGGYNVFRDDPYYGGAHVLITNAFAWENTDDGGDGIMNYGDSDGNTPGVNYHLTSTNPPILAYPHPWRAAYFGGGGGGPSGPFIYWVDKDHASSSDANAGTSESLPWKTIYKANNTVAAGDIVYIKAASGGYTASTTNFVAPAVSGTAAAKIVYAGYGSTPILVTSGDYGIQLNGIDNIVISNIVFTNLNMFFDLSNGATNNTIQGNTFTNGVYTDWEGAFIHGNSSRNIIRSNWFGVYGECGANDLGVLLEIGGETSGTDQSDFNLIEDNVFARGGHHVLGVHSRFNVIRRNYLYNDAWMGSGGTNGNRTLYMLGVNGYSGFNLIERNRFGYAAKPCDDVGSQGIIIASSYNIFRYNSSYNHNLNGLGLQNYIQDCASNLVYNCTFFNNCRTNVGAVGAAEKGGIMLGDWNAFLTTANRIKNNLFYAHPNDGNQPIGENGALRANQVIANNYDGDVSGDPQFVNATTNFPAVTDKTLPDLNLLITSPAINAAGALTTVSSGGGSSTTSITLVDASYFQDGTYGTGLMQGDYIAVGTVGNVVQITARSGNTLTLNNPISCANGNSVWLVRISDGLLVLNGSGPDYGAYEFTPPVTEGKGRGVKGAGGRGRMR